MQGLAALQNPARSQIADERRAHQRSDYANTLQLQYEGDSTWSNVYGRDFSAGGFSFFSDTEMHAGDRVWLCIPEMSATVFAATIRHAHRCRDRWVVGVQFDQPLDATTESLLSH